jgi:pilus assembly protein Flp/PilA
MAALILRFIRNDFGLTAIEYGLVAGIVSIVIITAARICYANLATIFTVVAAGLGG